MKRSVLQLYILSASGIDLLPLCTDDIRKIERGHSF